MLNNPVSWRIKGGVYNAIMPFDLPKGLLGEGRVADVFWENDSGDVITDIPVSH